MDQNNRLLNRNLKHKKGMNEIFNVLKENNCQPNYSIQKSYHKKRRQNKSLPQEIKIKAISEH
jgi:hypothetical protein